MWAGKVGLVGCGFGVVAYGAGDGFEEMADAFIPGDLNAEVTGFIEELSEVAAHVRGDGADDFVGGYAGFADALADVLLDTLAVEDLIGSLVGANGSVAGGEGSLGPLASITHVFVDELLLTVCKLGLAGGWVDSSFRHRYLLEIKLAREEDAS